MVWVFFSEVYGHGDLYFLPQNKIMNKKAYIKVLEDHLFLHYDIHDCNMFMHDGAPCHRNIVVKRLLADKNIPVLDWPGNSPDLNPIKNAWHIVKNKVGEKCVTSVPNLTCELKKIWMEIEPLYWKTLSDSMPKCIADVLKVKRNISKY